MIKPPLNFMRQHLKYSSSYFSKENISYMGLFPILDKHITGAVAAGIGIGITRPYNRYQRRDTAMKRFKENQISAKTFAAEYYESGGNVEVLNNEFVHAYKSNSKIKETNPSHFDLETTGNQFAIAKTNELWRNDHLVLVAANKVEDVISPLPKPVVLKKNSFDSKYGSITNATFDYIKQPNSVTNEKNNQYYVGQEPAPCVVSHISSGSFWNTPVGGLFTMLIPIGVCFFGGVVYNRVFNGVWVKPSLETEEHSQLVKKEANLLPNHELKNDKNLLSSSDEIILERKELSDKSILYSVPTYDIYFPSSKENKANATIIRENLSQEEAIFMVNDLSKYGVFMAISKYNEGEK